MEDTRTEEREAGPAVHGPLQHLEPVELAFGRACGPGQVEGGLHGGEVVAQAGGELRQRRAGCVGEHCGQALLALAAQQQVEQLGKPVNKAIVDTAQFLKAQGRVPQADNDYSSYVTSRFVEPLVKP